MPTAYAKDLLPDAVYEDFVDEADVRVVQPILNGKYLELPRARSRTWSWC